MCIYEYMEEFLRNVKFLDPYSRSSAYSISQVSKLSDKEQFWCLLFEVFTP